MPLIRRYLYTYSCFLATVCLVGVLAQEVRDGTQREASHDLGVASVQLYAKAPILDKEKVFLLNVWLKRVTPLDNSSATQAAQAIHGFAWAEDLDYLNRNQDGHLLMGIDQNVWQPRLRLETQRGAVVEARSALELVRAPQARSSLRPFHFTFNLDPKYPGRCYKIYEDSFPGVRASFCLPASSARLCRRLGPAEEATEPPGRAAAPALWALVLPTRTLGINGTHWEYSLRLAANRIYNYALYHIGIGAAGVLVYVDRLTRAHLDRLPRVQSLAARGHLVFVEWEMPERAPLAYKYDQALVASHALLGLSSCGPSVNLLVGDMDEYLYSPRGTGWPGIHACLAGADRTAVVHRIQRIQALSSRLDPAKEGAWWVLPARGLGKHPIVAYDKLAKEALRADLAKVIAAPYGRVVGFYATDGFPVHGTSQLASGECAFLLHLPNYWNLRPRRSGGRAAAAAAVAAAAAGDQAAVAVEGEFTAFKLITPWTPAGTQAAAAVEAGISGGGSAAAAAAAGRATGLRAGSGSDAATSEAAAAASGGGGGGGAQRQRQRERDPMAWMATAKVKLEDAHVHESARKAEEEARKAEEEAAKAEAARKAAEEKALAEKAVSAVVEAPARDPKLPVDDAISAAIAALGGGEGEDEGSDENAEEGAGAGAGGGLWAGLQTGATNAGAGAGTGTGTEGVQGAGAATGTGAGGIWAGLQKASAGEAGSGAGA